MQAENGAAYEESPEMEIRETKELPEASEAAENIDSIYESIDLKKAKKQEFGTKTLILGTKDAEIDPKGAIEKIPVGGDVFALVYDSAEAAEAAYEAYAGMEGIDFVEPDHVVEIEDTDNTETGLPGETAPKSTEAESSTEAMPKAAETESPKETEPENTQTGLSEETAQTAVCIAVIDTGICPDAGLAGAYLENSEAAADDNGHGRRSRPDRRLPCSRRA